MAFVRVIFGNRKQKLTVAKYAAINLLTQRGQIVTFKCKRHDCTQFFFELSLMSFLCQANVS